MKTIALVQARMGSTIARGYESRLPARPAEFDCEDADLINPSRWQH